jgi:predicted short-subunit dehydrogenase-like oxidoreductase (DUF2520 family)
MNTTTPTFAFIGAGRVATALARAMSHRGMPVTHVASRDPQNAARLAADLPDCSPVEPARAAAADVVFLTVPDDDIAAVAAQLPWKSGQMAVHCSGATEISVLDPAARAGALTGGFHPLQIFSDPELAERRLAGSFVAIEGPPPLAARLQEVAGLLEMRVLHLPPGARARYHGAASFAASFLVSMLEEAAAIWASFGVGEDDALEALLPLAYGTLDAARSKGFAGALAGPLSRGDAGVVQGHLRDLDRLGAGHGALYREFARRQLDLLERGGRLDQARLWPMRELLGNEGKS